MSGSATMLPLATLRCGLTVQQIQVTRCICGSPRSYQGSKRYTRMVYLQALRSNRHLLELGGLSNSSSRLYSLGSHTDHSQLYRQLDNYLPPALRSSLKSQFDSVEDSQTQRMLLPEFLHQFRRIARSRALSFLAARDDRLEAFVFLANELISIKPEPAHNEAHVDSFLDQSPWLQPTEMSISLDALSLDPHVFEQQHKPTKLTPNIDEVVDSWNGAYQREDAQFYREAMGDLWTALGEIAVRASNLSERPAKVLMQHVQLLLARMHSQGLVPPDIYNYDESHVPKARRKPPYLHILESRMMATMSDASWDHQSSQDSLSPWKTDGEIPPVVIDEPLSTHQLHPNVWLEFVMWACVRQGFYVEAAKLISAACVTANDVAWKALTWDQVLALQAEPQKRQQSWFDRLMSVDEGYNQERPLIEMPPKTISCEVIVSVLQGLLSLEDTKRIRSARRKAFYAYCHSLKDQDAAQTLFLNAVIQQLDESSDLDPRVITQLLIYQIQSFSRQEKESSGFTATTSISMEDIQGLSNAFAELQSSPYICHAISAWESVILHGNVADALQLFEIIRAIPQLLPGSIQHGNQTMRRKGVIPDYFATADLSSTSSSRLPHLPESILVWFLQLLVRTNNLDGAKRLLYNHTFGLRNNTAKAIFQPALLQAAVAVGDKELLTTIVQDLNIGFDALPDDVLYAVYEAQIWLGVFNDSARLLRVMQRQRHLAMKPLLVVATACKYIAIVSSGDVEAKPKRISKFLTDILNGEFLPARDPSRPLDYTEPRTLSQLIRILRSAHQSIEALPLDWDVYTDSQINTPVAIHAEAFNPLLEMVAKLQGTDAARNLFDIWCQPSPPPSVQVIDEGVKVVPAAFEGEKVVTPTLETVQIVLQSPLEDLRAWSRGGPRRHDSNRRLLRWMDSQSEVQDHTRLIEMALPLNAPHRELFEWAAKTLQLMGYDDYAINGVIPGAFPDAK